jgi:cytosine/adenosine deaminase-related metal-dependent hydrolase
MKRPALLQPVRLSDLLRLAQLLSTTMHTRGFIDGHIHADRVGTFFDAFFKHEGGLNVYVDAPLVVKQDAVGVLHRGVAYATEEELFVRMELIVKLKIAAGEPRTNFIVDCSTDLDGRAFRAALKLRKKYERRILIDVAIYPIFGIEKWESPQHLHLKELAPKAQFIVGLPERDARGNHPLGFEGHIALLYELAVKHRLPMHVHVDQTNTPQENGTQRLIAAIRTLSGSLSPEKRPEVWGVHGMFGGKEDEEVVEIIEGLRETRIGFYSCPHAAVSMRPMRNHRAPIHPPLAPIREMLVAKIPVRLGTDNTCDLLMPMPELPLLVREMDTLASTLRYYDKNVLWKLARQQPLNATDRASVAQNLARDYEAFGMANPWAKYSN